MIPFPDREVGAPLKPIDPGGNKFHFPPFPDREVGAPLKREVEAAEDSAHVHSPTARSGLR